VLSSDDALDALRTALFHRLISFMQREPNHIPQGMNLMSIVRNLERVADHATNVAEDVLFYVKGIDVRNHAEGTAKEVEYYPRPGPAGPAIGSGA
jgi:phosphate transport system protein